MVKPKIAKVVCLVVLGKLRWLVGFFMVVNQSYCFVVSYRVRILLQKTFRPFHSIKTMFYFIDLKLRQSYFWTCWH